MKIGNQFARKYSVNPTIFKNITPESAYLLGFLCADGYIHKNRKTYCIEFYNTNQKFLKKINILLESNYPIIKRKKGCSDIRIFSKKMFRLLKKLGYIANNKKKIILLNTYHSHFLRGYFDGDGSIGIYSGFLRVLITCHNKQFLEDIQTHLYKTLEIKGLLKVRKNKRNWDLFYHQREAIPFCNYIYEDSDDLYMESKKRIFDNCLKQQLVRVKQA